MEQSYFEVLRPGINSTFQDKGRFSVQYMGLAPGGAMDWISTIVTALFAVGFFMKSS